MKFSKYWFAIIVLAALAAQVLILRSFRQYESLLHLREAINFTERRVPLEASSRARLAIAADPYNGYGHYYVGAAALIDSKYAEAAQALEKAKITMPHRPNILRLTGQAYFYMQEYGTASRDLEEYFQIDPNSTVTRDYMMRLRAIALHRSDHLGLAAVELVDAETLPDYRNELLQFRVANALMLNLVTLADYGFKRLRRFNPTGSVEPAAILNEALSRGKLRPLLRYIQMLRLRGEADPETLKALGLALIRKQKPEEAITILSQVKNLAPNDPDPYLFLGDIYAKQIHDPTMARTNYRRHLEISPNSQARDSILQWLAANDSSSTATRSSDGAGNLKPVQSPGP